MSENLLYKSRQLRCNERKYVNDHEDYALPSLIEVQLNSYQDFLENGLRELFDEISPIEDFTGKNLELHFKDYRFEAPKHSETEARTKNATWEQPLNVTVHLINKVTGEVKEQEVFMGSIPMMTDRGTFIINGVERVVVSQIIRASGIFIVDDQETGRYAMKFIPNRGVWLEVEVNKKGVISVKVDRKRKIPVTALLRAFGYETDKEIMDLFSDLNEDMADDFILRTLEKDTTSNEEEALHAVYKRIRPGDLATTENVRSMINSMFFDFRKYDIGTVGRYKVNQKFDINKDDSRANRVFQVDDFVLGLKELIRVCRGESVKDDIDHLGHRRIKAVGELIASRFRVGLLRTERIIKDRMTVLDIDTVTPNKLINSRPVSASVREFFSSSQLSQFMDQINPLAQLDHSRRVSAMGPGGLQRERASLEVRDVHPSHYGRICPISTPEGQNIGLVINLATYAKVNKYGYIETPYREVKHVVKNDGKAAVGHTFESKEIGKGIIKTGEVIDEKAATELAKLKDIAEVPVRAFVTKNIKYYDAHAEKDMIVAQANTKREKNGEFVDSLAEARRNLESSLVSEKQVTHMDVSHKQIVSVSTSLIPFLEHNESTRALMASNMQRQAVSLILPEAPLVGTGMEHTAAVQSGQVVVAPEAGVVSYVDGNEVRLTLESGKEETYLLTNYQRSNANTCFHQRPIVTRGDKVKKGQALIDGASCQNGELALGRNLRVAYMPYEGLNYEDAIIVSERLVRDDVFSSIHINTYPIDVRETKLGPEIVSRDIPNVGEERLKDLDENGIIRIGAEVSEGSILVGKMTPKGETELTPEERLLRAIFGEKSRDVKDTSLKLSHGEKGKVVGVRIFTGKDGDELPPGVISQIHVDVAEVRNIQVGDKMAGRHGNKGVISRILPVADMPYLEDGTPVDIILNPLGVVSRMNIGQILETHLGWAAEKLGHSFATPVLNGVKSEQIAELLEKAGLPVEGTTTLFNGKTGEAFDEKVCVGMNYMLKLNHLIEDKMHARSIGPYSLVTQQPLGGKAQMGGQRLGEMEVWALEAYGVSHILQEILTIKSDDVVGRAKAYESIIKDEEIRRPRTPESFNVLVRELMSLGLNVELAHYKDKFRDYESEDIVDQDVAMELEKQIESQSHTVVDGGATFNDKSEE